jgi:hypothetical protein
MAERRASNSAGQSRGRDSRHVHGAAGCGIDPGIMQDLPHRGGGDRVAELDELAVNWPVPPGRVVRRDADHELADCGGRGRPAGPPPPGVVPFAGDESPVPGEQCRRGHREDLGPSASGDQPGQFREPQPAGRLVAGAPGARQPWTPHAGPAPLCSRADGMRAGRPPRRSLSDDLSPQDWPGQIE